MEMLLHALVPEPRGSRLPGEGCKVTLDASFDVPVDVTNQVGVTLEEGTVVLVVSLQPGVAEAHAAVALAHLVPVGAPPPVQIFIPGWLGPDFLGTLATRGSDRPIGYVALDAKARSLACESLAIHLGVCLRIEVGVEG